MDRYEISAPRLAKKMADMQQEIESLTKWMLEARDDRDRCLEEIESLRRELAHYKRVLRVIGRSVEDAGLDDKWEE